MAVRSGGTGPAAGTSWRAGARPAAGTHLGVGARAAHRAGALRRRGMFWLKGAACAGPQAPLFFGPDDEKDPARRRREGRARTVCASCPVRAECLDYALDHHIRYGFWGGLNEKERFAERIRRTHEAPATRGHTGRLDHR